MRERREEELQIELSRAVAALVAQQERAVDAEETVRAELEELRDMMRDGAPLHAIRFKQEELAVARSRAQHEATSVEQLEEVAGDRRRELLGASQDREALDRLRDRQREAHRKELLRIEEAELDEIASGRAARERRSVRA